MKRTPLSRDPDKVRAFQRRGRKALKNSPLNPVNHERLNRLREKQYGDKADWIVQQPCIVGGEDCGRFKVIPAHAAKTRGAGGTSEDLVPLCIRCEITLHHAGVVTFERMYSLHLEAESEHYERVWQRINHSNSDDEANT